MKVMAIDPGKTNGIAVYDNGQFKAFQMNTTDFPQAHLTFLEVIRTHKPDIILYEAFYFRQQKTGVDYTPVEYIAIVKLYVQLEAIQDRSVVSTSYNPSTAKAFWTDDKLKVLGLYRRGAPHAMDALRILLYHLVFVDKTIKDEILEKLK